MLPLCTVQTQLVQIIEEANKQVWLSYATFSGKITVCKVFSQEMLIAQ